jgi:hypothetical protein
MIKTIEGIYQNGQVRFTKLPQGIVDHQDKLSTDLSHPAKPENLTPRRLISKQQCRFIHSVFQRNASLYKGVSALVNSLPLSVKL